MTTPEDQLAEQLGAHLFAKARGVAVPDAFTWSQAYMAPRWNNAARELIAMVREHDREAATQARADYAEIREWLGSLLNLHGGLTGPRAMQLLADELAGHIAGQISAAEADERVRLVALLRTRADTMEAQRAVIAPKMLREVADDIEKGEL